MVNNASRATYDVIEVGRVYADLSKKLNSPVYEILILEPPWLTRDDDDDSASASVYVLDIRPQTRANVDDDSAGSVHRAPLSLSSSDAEDCILAGKNSPSPPERYPLERAEDNSAACPTELTVPILEGDNRLPHVPESLRFDNDESFVHFDSRCTSEITRDDDDFSDLFTTLKPKPTALEPLPPCIAAPPRTVTAPSLDALQGRVRARIRQRPKALSSKYRPSELFRPVLYEIAEPPHHMPPSKSKKASQPVPPAPPTMRTRDMYETPANSRQHADLSDDDAPPPASPYKLTLSESRQLAATPSNFQRALALQQPEQLIISTMHDDSIYVRSPQAPPLMFGTPCARAPVMTVFDPPAVVAASPHLGCPRDDDAMDVDGDGDGDPGARDEDTEEEELGMEKASLLPSAMLLRDEPCLVRHRSAHALSWPMTRSPSTRQVLRTWIFPSTSSAKHSTTVVAHNIPALPRII
ncbi:hypothetical protein BDZ89DRAFT_265203 [Hymenopellis radicata]|nr:hypothetical protein BDZ89DRAFT_265203 [Hymenopellis radicata]